MESDLVGLQYLKPEAREARLRSATPLQFAAYAVGMQYHSWYEATKSLAWRLETQQAEAVTA
jgi:hypothetical protein